MGKVYLSNGGWKAVLRASRADCVLMFNDWVMARGDKSHITRLFYQFVKLQGFG